jgi:glycosyltransferase involved in cell wall biosynthesis
MRESEAESTPPTLVHDGPEREGADLSATVTSALFVTPRWARDGGVGAHVIASAALLAKRRIDVTVLTGLIDSDTRIDGVRLCERGELFNNDASVENRLGDALSLDPDVIHLHQIDDPAIVDALRVRAPVVISAHGYTACTSGVYYFRPGQECTRAHGPGCVPNLIARGCAHARNPASLPSRYIQATKGVEALRRADLAVSYSSFVDRHLAANGIARRAVVPYFPTMACRAGSGHATRRRVVFAGRIVAPKGVGVLVRAARDVDAEFVICGDGRALQAMRRLARRVGVQGRVTFTGWLDAAELAGQLAEASVVAVPSVWPEPFGLVGIEGFAAGRPAVATATGGIRDWLQDGVSGLCVAPGDARELAGALNRLLADPDTQERMGAAGKRVVDARFSPQRHLATLLAAYADARSAWERAGASPS